MSYLTRTTPMQSLWMTKPEVFIEGMVRKYCLTRSPPTKLMRRQTSGGNVLSVVDRSPLMKDNSILTSTHAFRGRQSEMPFNRSSKYL